MRYVDGKTEAWEITLSAGKIAQPAVESWRDSLPLPADDDEAVKQEMDVMGGRIVATVSRMEELEGELLRRAMLSSNVEEWTVCGVPVEEIEALRKTDEQRVERAMELIDTKLGQDERLRLNRAKSVFAMFLHELEGPGLRQNKVVLPCMEVDFLDSKQWQMLFGDGPREGGNAQEDRVASSPSQQQQPEPQQDSSNRPSLHPIAMEAIEESFRLRAQNSTTSPLRIIDSSIEWYEVEYAAMKFADRFLQRHSSEYTQEELQTIGGRIVGVLMRMDDLEWEWNHRVVTSALGQVTPEIDWKRTLGLHPVMEQKCCRTIDIALMEDMEFARKRAEMMYAMFLMNIEEPGMKASGGSVVGGSSAADFINNDKYLQLMMPRMKK